MPTLTIMPSGKTVEITEGKSVLDQILSAEVGILHKCDGKAECGSCHIYLQQGRKGVSRIGADENAKLDTIVGIGSKSRLACQATLLGTEDVTVEVLDFASGL